MNVEQLRFGQIAPAPEAKFIYSLFSIYFVSMTYIFIYFSFMYFSLLFSLIYIYIIFATYMWGEISHLNSCGQ